MSKLAIVGSRDFTDYDFLCRKIEENFKIEDLAFIVSGGCRGTDSLAEKFAKDNSIETIIYKPDWNAFGKKAGPMRNTLIVNECTHMIAFLSPDSIGTRDSINKAKKKGINPVIIEV